MSESRAAQKDRSQPWIFDLGQLCSTLDDTAAPVPVAEWIPEAEPIFADEELPEPTPSLVRPRPRPVRRDVPFSYLFGLGGFMALGLTAVVWAWQPAPPRVTTPPKAACEVCVAPGRQARVQFVADPSVAAQQARAENKLLLILTISGNFEDSRFT